MSWQDPALKLPKENGRYRVQLARRVDDYRAATCPEKLECNASMRWLMFGTGQIVPQWVAETGEWPASNYTVTAWREATPQELFHG